MEATSYSDDDRVEAFHWWFKGRRALFGRILRQLGIAQKASVLDAGTSVGTNLRLLRDAGYTNFRGLELSERAIAICTEKGLGPIERGDICQMPFHDRTFDFVLATDVIEHIDRDDTALKEIRRVLKPGGYCLVTVPAFPSLWGHQDVQNHHKRRYRLKPLLDLIRESGLAPETWYHFNFLLFLPIWCMRQILRRFAEAPRSEIRMNTPLTNRILDWIFAIDLRMAPILKPAFGVSLLVLCRRPLDGTGAP